MSWGSRLPVHDFSSRFVSTHRKDLRSDAARFARSPAVQAEESTHLEGGRGYEPLSVWGERGADSSSRRLGAGPDAWGRPSERLHVPREIVRGMSHAASRWSKTIAIR